MGGFRIYYQPINYGRRRTLFNSLADRVMLLYVLCGGWISSSSSGAPRICHDAMLCVESIYICIIHTEAKWRFMLHTYIVRALRIYCCRYAFLAQFAMLSYPFDVHTHLPLWWCLLSFLPSRINIFVSFAFFAFFYQHAPSFTHIYTCTVTRHSTIYLFIYLKLA